MLNPQAPGGGDRAPLPPASPPSAEPATAPSKSHAPQSGEVKQSPPVSLGAAIASKRPILISVKDEEAPASAVASLVAAGYDVRYGTSFPDMTAAFAAGGEGGKPVAVIAPSGSKREAPADAVTVRVLPDKGEQLPRSKEEEDEDRAKEALQHQDRVASVHQQEGKGSGLIKPYRTESAPPPSSFQARGVPTSSGGITVHP